MAGACSRANTHCGPARKERKRAGCPTTPFQGTLLMTQRPPSRPHLVNDSDTPLSATLGTRGPLGDTQDPIYPKLTEGRGEDGEREREMG